MLQSGLLSTRADVRHGFTTAVDASGQPRSLGVGATAAAWSAALDELGAPDAGLARVSQVHGCAVLEATGPGVVGEADALFTRERGLVLAIRTADCVPVLLVGDGVVAAVHAGWRGVAAGVVPATLAALGGGGGLVAAVGPAISGAVYEVGPEVVAAFEEAGIPRAVFLVETGGPRPHVDPKAAVAWQLAAGGVDRVEVLPQCTFSDPTLHSHRRDGAASGRLAALVARC